MGGAKRRKDMRETQRGEKRERLYTATRVRRLRWYLWPRRCKGFRRAAKPPDLRLHPAKTFREQPPQGPRNLQANCALAMTLVDSPNLLAYAACPIQPCAAAQARRQKPESGDTMRQASAAPPSVVAARGDTN